MMIDMTLAEMAMRKNALKKQKSYEDLRAEMDSVVAKEKMEKSEMAREIEKKKRLRKMAQIAFIGKAVFSIPCGLFAFLNVTVFVEHPMVALKMIGVIACLGVIASMWTDACKGFEE